MGHEIRDDDRKHRSPHHGTATRASSQTIFQAVQRCLPFLDLLFRDLTRLLVLLELRETLRHLKTESILHVRDARGGQDAVLSRENG